MEIHFHRPLFTTFAAGTDAPGSGVRSQPSHHVAQVHVAGEIGIGIEKKPRPAAGNVSFCFFSFRRIFVDF